MAGNIYIHIAIMRVFGTPSSFDSQWKPPPPPPISYKTYWVLVGKGTPG